MNSPIKINTTMVPVSGRIPEDLYQWLSTTPLEGATTVSDKLRVAVATLKRLQDGDADYNGALAMHRDLVGNARRQLAEMEPRHGHSEVLSTIMEHAPAISAAVTSAQIKSLPDAIKLEDQLTQRSLQLAEGLLRQAITRQARAYDGQVVIKNAQSLIELAQMIYNNSTRANQGGLNG
jgi:hypothetical protein